MMESVERLKKENERLYAVVDAFAEQMKVKLAWKAREGWHGWDEPDFVDSGRCLREMITHAARMAVTSESTMGPTIPYNQAVDVALFAMFLDYRESEKMAQKVASHKADMRARK